MLTPPRRTWSLNRTAIAAAVVMGSLLFAGCDTQSAPELMASARGFIDQGDPKAAIIQLKAALQVDGQSAEARYLLGKTLLDVGNTVGAAAELERAADMGYAADLVLPLLGRALVSTNQAKVFVDLHGRTRLTDPKQHAELRAWLAAGYAQLGQTERAEASMNTALQLDPDNLLARTLLARLTAGRGELDEALRLVESILQQDAGRVDVWQLKGELLAYLKRDRDGAAAAFREALKINPRHLPGHTALMSLALQYQDVAAFKQQLAEMTRDLPRSPQTLFFTAQDALLDGEVQRARELSQALMRLAPGNERILQLSGAIELHGGSLVVAQTNLVKALQLSPGLLVARRLLGQTYLRAGQPARALVTLQPLIEGARIDPQALALIAEAHLQGGQFEQSERYFREAARLFPDDAKVLTALALTQIAKGETDSGFTQLENLARSDPSTYADLALISARLRRKEWSAALQAIDGLEPKMAKHALPGHLRGRVLVAQGQTDAARASFDQAINKDKRYFPAVASLAELEVKAGQFAQAEQRVRQHLATEPRSFQALLLLAQIKQQSGAAPGEVQALFTEAVRANPGEAAPRLLLVNHLLAHNQPAAAKAAAQEAVSRLPDNPELLDALGRSHVAVGEVQQAISAFGKVVASQPSSVPALARLAQAHLENKDIATAQRTLRRALEIDPRSQPVHTALMRLALRDKRPADALAVARAVQTQRPKEAAGWLMEVELQATQQKWAPAVAAAKRALQLERTTANGISLHKLMLRAGATAEADQHAAAWRSAHPGDVVFLFHLGIQAMEAREFKRAEALYRAVVALRPKDATALNNLAWVLAEQGRPEAIAFAQQATALAPDNASLMDTLSLALSTQGQLDQALQWQRKAADKAPADPNIRLRLAELLVKTGDKTSARTELEALGRLGERFARQAEVTQLLSTL